jgi:hypothetical protein
MSAGFIAQVHASHVLAFLLVCFYAWSRFNTPRTVRAQTSRFQYFASGITYVLSCAGLWIGITLAIEQNPQWLAILHPAPADGTRIDALEAPLVAALMLTTLLPSVPMLNAVDGKILAFFHTIGEIPFGAVRWAQRMEDAAFEMRASLVDDAAAYVRDSDDLATSLTGQLSADKDGAPQQYRFTRVLALYVWLKKYRSRARFDADFPDDTDAFEKRMRSYFAQSAGFFAMAAQLPPPELAALPDSVRNFRVLSKDAYEDVRLMLARLLLYSNNREAQIASELRSLGFTIAPRAGVTFPFNLLALDWIGVVVLFGIVAILTAAPGGDVITRRLSIGLLVAVNHCVAAAFAILPKQLWAFANRDGGGERPVLAYVLSGLLTLTVVLALSAVVYSIRLGLPHAETLLPFGAQCKWLALSTVLAVLLAFACDNYVTEAQAPRWLRWAESVSIAGGMALVGYVVVTWLAADLAATGWRTPAQPWLPVALSAVIGALFGATIPHWYRQTVHKVMQPPSANLAPLPVVVPGLPAKEP